MPRNLMAALAAGMRPGPGLRASLESWLGVPISLENHGFWKAWSGASGGSSWTGQHITAEKALQLATVWACVRLIAETLATLPLGFYQRQVDGSRVPATRHPLYEILHNQPNADMTAVTFWEVVVASLLLWGDSYNEILRGGRDAVIGLDFLYPARVKRRNLASGGYEWKYLDPTGGERTIAEANMMHTLGFSTDGKCGLSPLAYGAQVMGMAIETDKTSAETFRDALRSPGLVMMDSILQAKQREEIRQHVKKVSEDGGVMVLEKGAGFEKIGFDPVTAELLASRKWNAEELCRLYGVDPAMIGITGKDSNWGTGLEQKMIWFVTLTLRKWCVRIEQAVRKSLLTPAERQIYFAEFAIEGLLRGDSAARSTFYSTMTQNGIMTRDDCRSLENLPRHGGNADKLTVQSNLLPIDQLGAASPGTGARDALLAWLAIEPSAGAPAVKE